MPRTTKLSPALDTLLAASDAKHKHDAIVIMREPDAVESLGQFVTGRSRRRLAARVQRVKDAAQSQHVAQLNLVDSYLKGLDARSRISGRAEFEGGGIGSGALPVVHLEVTRQTVPELEANPEVVAILANQKLDLIEPAAAVFERPSRRELNRKITWGLEALGAPELWQTTKGRGVTVAVLDTGVHGDHPVLDNRVRGFKVFDPLGRAITASPSFDGGEHGTHVCGTIAGGTTEDGISIGVAPEADLLAGGVLIGRGTLLALVAGLVWALDEGADVINMSLGFPAFEPAFTLLFDRVIDRFGTIPVVAIGNASHGNTGSPGNAPSALSVGAVGQATATRNIVADFSGGASLEFPGDADHPLVTKPDVVAPGVGIYSSVPPQKVREGSFQYKYMNGTSMATPHVAGATALLMAAKPNAPVRDIIGALTDTARHPEGADLRPDNRWGFGEIRPVEALKKL